MPKTLEYDANGLLLTNIGASPYYGASWYSRNPDAPWMAAVGIPSGLEHRMPSRATCVQLGFFDDPRDACYVAMMFQENASLNMAEFERVGTYNWRPMGGIPKWEHPALENSNVAVRRRVIHPPRVRPTANELTDQQAMVQVVRDLKLKFKNSMKAAGVIRSAIAEQQTTSDELRLEVARRSVASYVDTHPTEVA